MSVGGIEKGEDKILEYLERLVRESIDECLAILRRIAMAGGENRNVCKTVEILDVLNRRLQPYMIELKPEHANQALESCYRDPNCYFESGGKKICKTECYPKHLAKIIYEMLQSKATPREEKIRPNILEELREALGISPVLRPEVVCLKERSFGKWGESIKVKTWPCDDEGIRMTLWCKVYEGLVNGIQPERAEIGALYFVMHLCGTERVIETLSKKPKAYIRYLPRLTKK